MEPKPAADSRVVFVRGQLEALRADLESSDDLQLKARWLERVQALHSLLDGPTLEPLAKALAGSVTMYDSEASSYKDGLYTETWMAQQCGITEVSDILPEHWR